MGKQKKKCTSSKGITLIALVITIIVLLILAGVSINIVAGENGILGKAQSAVLENKKGQILEEAQMLISEWQTDYFVNKVPLDGRSGQTESGADVICTGSEIIVVDNSASGKAYKATYSKTTGLESFNDIPNDTTSQMYKATHPEEHTPSGYEYVEGTWSTGYVIKETSTGDEFVWIPVVSPESYVKKSGSKNYSISTQNIPGEDVVSLYVSGDDYGANAWITNSDTEISIVNNVGGFWVSRYEVGITSADRTMAQSGWTTSSIMSKRGAEPVRSINQTEALALANTWKTGENVQSGLITGTQWDVMCNFIGWSICDGDCTKWGNYYNSVSKPYTDNIGHSGMNINYEKWYIGTIQKLTNNYGILASGIFESLDGINTSRKNIFDVAGNVWEWTTETISRDSSKRVVRGGSSYATGEKGAANARDGYNSTSRVAWDIGFRAVLYVK